MENPSGGHGTDLRTTLYVRNLPYLCRYEHLHRPFRQFGAILKIFLPRDYNTGELLGYGFVYFENPADAAVAKDQMNRHVLLGRELSVSYAKGKKMTPSEMRERNKGRYRGRFDRRRSPSRRFPPQHHARSRPRSYDYASRRRSVSPRDRQDRGEVEVNVRHGAELNGSRSRSRNPSHVRGRSLRRSRSRSVSRSRSPRRSRRHEEEYRSDANGEDSKV